MSTEAAPPSLIRNAAILLVAQVVTSALGAATLIVMPIYLGDVGLGRLAFAQSLCTLLASVAALGTTYYVVKAVAADRNQLASLVWTNLVLRIPLWALGSVIILVFLLVRSTSLEAAAVVVAFCVITLVSLSNGVLVAALQGLEAMGWQSVAAVAGSGLTFGAGLPVLMLTRSPLAFSAAVLAGTLATLAVNAVFFRRMRLARIHPDLVQIRRLLVGSLPFLAFSVSQGIYGQINVLALGIVANEAAVGWFAAGSRLAPLILFGPVVVTTALLPALSRLYAGRADAADRALRRALELTLLVTVPLACGLSLIAARLIVFIHYPAAFSRTVPILTILCLSWALTAVVMVLGTGLVACGRQNEWAAAGMALLAVFVILNFLLIPISQRLFSNGGTGAALADVGGELAALLIAIILLPRRVLSTATFNYTLRTLFAAGLMAAGIVATSRTPLPVSVIASGLIYGAASLALQTLTKDDIRLAWSALRTRSAGREAAGAVLGQMPSAGGTAGDLVPGQPIPTIL
jgi:O-antigen/teichoic acid export membrane protein